MQMYTFPPEILHPHACMSQSLPKVIACVRSPPTRVPSQKRLKMTQAQAVYCPSSLPKTVSPSPLLISSSSIIHG